MRTYSHPIAADLAFHIQEAERAGGVLYLMGDCDGFSRIYSSAIIDGEVRVKTEHGTLLFGLGDTLNTKVG